jgi:uncharacterized SAM-binding protein YcdF (DUF218 family)
MFFFLSKLLPLFIYPVGFAGLMMAIALLTLRKQRVKTARNCIALALIYLLVAGNATVANAFVKSLEWQNLPTDLPKAEAIVVLGGATRSAIPPRPSVDLMEEGDRVIRAAQLYRQGKAPIVVLSGGRVDWQGGGAPESEDMARLLQEMGVPATAMLQDPTSLNTYENAVNVKKILQEKKIQRVLLVTSAMHMPRSLRIFKKQGIEAIAAPADFLVSRQEMEVLNASNEGKLMSFLPDVETMREFTRALKEYVGTGVYWLRGWV